MQVRECTTAAEVKQLAREVERRRHAPPVATPRQAAVIKMTWDEAWVFEKPSLPAAITLRSITEAVCESYQVGREELLSRRQFRSVATPRQVAFYLARLLTTKPLKEIGAFFGRDHTSCLHGSRKIARLRKVDRELNERLRMIELRFGHSSTPPSSVTAEASDG